MGLEDNEYWRGIVDQKLDSLDTKMEDLCRKIDRLTDKVDSLDKQLGNGTSKFVTWEYLRNRLAIPIILATITFLLFTIGPAVLIIIYLTLDQTP